MSLLRLAGFFGLLLMLGTWGGVARAAPETDETYTLLEIAADTVDFIGRSLMQPSPLTPIELVNRQLFYVGDELDRIGQVRSLQPVCDYPDAALGDLYVDESTAAIYITSGWAASFRGSGPAELVRVETLDLRAHCMVRPIPGLEAEALQPGEAEMAWLASLQPLAPPHPPARSDRPPPYAGLSLGLGVEVGGYAHGLTALRIGYGRSFLHQRLLLQVTAVGGVAHTPSEEDLLRPSAYTSPALGADLDILHLWPRLGTRYGFVSLGGAWRLLDLTAYDLLDESLPVPQLYRDVLMASVGVGLMFQSGCALHLRVLGGVDEYQIPASGISLSMDWLPDRRR